MIDLTKLEAAALIIRATWSDCRDAQAAALAEMHRRRLWLGSGEAMGSDDQEAMAIRAAGLIPPPNDMRGERAAILKAMGYRHDSEAGQ